MPKSDVTSAAPTFKIKRFEGPYKSSEHDKDDANKQALNQDFSYFINKDVLFRECYTRLRRLAVTLFTCACLSLAIAVADIELARIARHTVSQNLGCTTTYERGWNRYCPALSNGNATTLGNKSLDETYYQRWVSAYWTYSWEYFVIGLCLKACLTFLTVLSVMCFIGYYKAELTVLRLKKYVPEDNSFLKSPKIRPFCVKLCLLCLHVPPFCDAWIEYEFQVIVLARMFICGIKILKECNELRYHRLGNVLSNLARVKIHSTFLIKTYFLRHPKTILLMVYFVVIGFFPYFVVMMERVEGNDITYLDASWLMVVTVTNLGSGEVRPQGLVARMFVGFGSVIGILTTALWVNVFSKYLDLPNEERRILSIVEHQRCRRLERNTAASCIQSAWRRYCYHKALSSGRKNSWRVYTEKAYKKSMWDWKCARQSIREVRRNLESDFNAEDTLIVARHMARRMSENRHKPLIIKKSSINKFSWDRKWSSPFLGISKSTVKPGNGTSGGSRLEGEVEGQDSSKSSLNTSLVIPSDDVTSSFNKRSTHEQRAVQRLGWEIQRLANQVTQLEDKTQHVYASVLSQIQAIAKSIDAISQAYSPGEDEQ